MESRSRSRACRRWRARTRRGLRWTSHDSRAQAGMGRRPALRGPYGAVQGSEPQRRSRAVMDRELRVEAVERAYRDHADDVYRIAFAILRDADGAVDATHDTF